MNYLFKKDDQGNPYLKVKLTDYALLSHPILNKGMAFTLEERQAFGLIGLIPPRETNLKEQRVRSYEAFQSKASPIEKYLYLRDLQDSNETLFYSLLTEHLEEMMPIVYTPTVGLGCQRFSHIYRRPRGIFIAYPHKDYLPQILSSSRFDRTQVIVVSDGERILGLGDQGAGGMGIPIGKLALYTACAGIHPANTLPILLDTGTNNTDLQNDPLYIGWPHERIRGKEYDEFIDLFVHAIQDRFPHVLLQWEDFAQQNANPLLERYRNTFCTFNDDIQGTAAVAVGTLLSAIKATRSSLKDQRIAILGAGSAGCGIASLMMKAMIDDGLSEAEAKKRFFLIDRSGLLMIGMRDLLQFQKPFAQSSEAISGWMRERNDMITLRDVIHNAHPTVLIGVSGQPAVFSQEIVIEMALHTERPIIFPLSNPTERAEAHPRDLLEWTTGKAIIGTGSPFGMIEYTGKSRRIDQTNNCYIFPGMGLGLIAVKAAKVTDQMFMKAAKALAECAPTQNNPNDNLLPPIHTIREVSLHVAMATAKEAIETGLAQHIPDEPLESAIKKTMWTPDYLPYKKWE